jgi:hypothetical protein
MDLHEEFRKYKRVINEIEENPDADITYIPAPYYPVLLHIPQSLVDRAQLLKARQRMSFENALLTVILDKDYEGKFYIVDTEDEVYSGVLSEFAIIDKPESY